MLICNKGVNIMNQEKENSKKKIIDKLNDIQEEILRIGWSGVLKKYHPDVNTEDPEAVNIFKLYKQIEVS
jgi:hypothetical protein